MQLSAAIQYYLIEIEVRKYTPKTIRGKRNNLGLFLRFCEDHADIRTTEELTPAVIRSFTAYMSEKGRKGTYINGLLKTIKSFIQYCYEEEYGGFNTKTAFKWCREEKPLVLAFRPEDVQAMLRDCNGNSFLQIRDKAIITMLFETGIRCGELCEIREDNMHDDFILINGKNHKQRAVPVTQVLRKALLRHDRAKENYFSLKETEDYYFLSFHGRQLTVGAVEHIIKRHGREIEGVRVSPHTCRHFFAQQQVKMGTDLYTISRLLGHENIRITQIYLESLQSRDIIEAAKNNSVIMSISRKGGTRK